MGARQWRNSGKGQTAGTAITIGNSDDFGQDAVQSFTSGATYTYQTSTLDAAKMRLTGTNVSAAACFIECGQVFADTLLSFGFEWDVPAALPSATTQIFSARTANTLPATLQGFGLNYRTDGKLQIVNAAGSSAAPAFISAAAIPRGKILRIDLKSFSDPTTGTIDISIFNVTDNVLVEQSVGVMVNMNTHGNPYASARFVKVAATTDTTRYDFGAVQGEDGRTSFMGAFADNTIPVANAGPDQTVEPWKTVTLAGSGTDADGTIASRLWRQISGPTVTLSSTTVNAPTFTSPADLTNQTFVFGFTVTDDLGGVSLEDTVTITVLQATAAYVSGGVWVPMRVVSGW